MVHEIFSFFSFLLKFYGVRGSLRLFYDLWGSTYLKDQNFVFFRRFFVDLHYSAFLLRWFDFSFFSWIFREFVLLWLPFSQVRFFVFFVDFS